MGHGEGGMAKRVVVEHVEVSRSRTAWSVSPLSAAAAVSFSPLPVRCGLATMRLMEVTHADEQDANATLLRDGVQVDGRGDAVTYGCNYSRTCIATIRLPGGLLLFESEPHPRSSLQECAPRSRRPIKRMAAAE
jgi:hypothetical protein